MHMKRYPDNPIGMVKRPSRSMGAFAPASVGFQLGHTVRVAVLPVYEGSIFYQKCISIKNFIFEESLVVWFFSDGAVTRYLWS